MRFYITNHSENLKEQDIIDLDLYREGEIIEPEELISRTIIQCEKDNDGDIVFEVD